MADIRQTGSQSWRDLQKENNSTFNPETATPQDWYRQLKKRDYNSYASQPTEYVGIKAAQAGFGNSQYDEGLVSTSQLNDLNDIRYQNQPWYDTLANGVVKMLGTAGTTFLSSLVGLPTGIGTAISEGRVSGLWDNSVTQALGDADKWFEDNFTNYRSTEQQNAPWYSPTNLLSMNFWADDVIKNAGFTLGAAASMAVGSGSLGLISRAFGAVNQASKGAGMAGKFASALFSATGEGMIEARNGVEERNKLETQRLNDALAPERQALEEEFNLINEEYNATKGQTLIKGADGRAYDPAYLRYRQRMQELSKKRNDLNQRYNDGLRQIEESGREMGNKILLGNLALLTAGNLIQFGKLMNKSFDNARHAAEITSKSTKPFGVAVKRAGESLKDGYKVTGKNFGRTVAATKGILTEGSEEMNQQWIQSSAGVSSNEIDANDYWRAKMSPDSYRETTKDLYSLGNTISQGFKDSWGDVNQWEQFVIGGLTGMAGSYAPTKIFNQDQTKSRLNPLRYGSWEGGAYNEIRDFNKQYRQQEENVEDLNKILAQENFGERTKNLIAHTYLENQKEDAVLAGDMKRWKDEDDKQAIHDIQAFLRAGKIDDLRAIYEEMGKDMSDEDIQGIIKATTQEISADRDKQNHDDAIDAQIADHRARISELQQKAQDIADQQEALKVDERGEYQVAVTPALENIFADIDKEYAVIDELEQQKQNYAGQTRYVSPYLNEDGSQRKSNDEIREEIKHNSDEMNRKLDSYLDSVAEVNRRTGGNLTKDQEDNLAYLHHMGRESIRRADDIVEKVRKDLPTKFLFKTDKTPEQLAKEYASSDLAFTKDDNTPEGYVNVDASMLAGHNFTDFLIRDIIWGRNQRPEFGETADERAAREEEEKNLDDEEKKKRRTVKWKKQYDEAKKNAEKQRQTNLDLIIDTFESNYKKNNRATEAETDIATGEFIGNIVDALGLMKQGGAFEKTLTEYMRNPQKVDEAKAKEEEKANKKNKEEDQKSKFAGKTARDINNDIANGDLSIDDVDDFLGADLSDVTDEDSKSALENAKQEAQKSKDIRQKQAEVKGAIINDAEENGWGDAAVDAALNAVDTMAANAEDAADINLDNIGDFINPADVEGASTGEDEMADLAQQVQDMIASGLNSWKENQDKKDDIPDPSTAVSFNNEPESTGHDSTTKMPAETAVPKVGPKNENNEWEQPIPVNTLDSSAANKIEEEVNKDDAGSSQPAPWRSTTRRYGRQRISGNEWGTAKVPYHELISDKNSVLYKRSKAIWEYLNDDKIKAWDNVDNVERDKIGVNDTIHFMIRNFADEIFGKSFENLSEKEKPQALVILMLDDGGRVLGDLPLAQFERGYNDDMSLIKSPQLKELKATQEKLFKAFEEKRAKTGCNEAVADKGLTKDGAENLNLTFNNARKSPLVSKISQMLNGVIPFSNEINTLNDIMGSKDLLLGISVTGETIATSRDKKDRRGGAARPIRVANVGQSYILIPSPSGALMPVPFYTKPFDAKSHAGTQLYRILGEVLTNLINNAGKSDTSTYKESMDVLEGLLQVRALEGARSTVEVTKDNVTLHLQSLTNPDQHIDIRVVNTGNAKDAAKEFLNYLSGTPINISLQFINSKIGVKNGTSAPYNRVIGEIADANLPKNTTHTVNNAFLIKLTTDAGTQRTEVRYQQSGTSIESIGDKTVKIDYDHYRAYQIDPVTKEETEIEGDEEVNQFLAEAKASHLKGEKNFKIELDGQVRTYKITEDGKVQLVKTSQGSGINAGEASINQQKEDRKNVQAPQPATKRIFNTSAVENKQGAKILSRGMLIVDKTGDASTYTIGTFEGKKVFYPSASLAVIRTSANQSSFFLRDKSTAVPTNAGGYVVYEIGEYEERNGAIIVTKEAKIGFYKNSPNELVSAGVEINTTQQPGQEEKKQNIQEESPKMPIAEYYDTLELLGETDIQKALQEAGYSEEEIKSVIKVSPQQPVEKKAKTIEEIEKEVGEAGIINKRNKDAWDAISDSLKLKMVNEGTGIVLKYGGNEVALDYRDFEQMKNTLKEANKYAKSGSMTAKEGTKYRRVKSEKERRADIRREREWLQKNLPMFNTEERLHLIQGLLEIPGEKNWAWGRFEKGIITLSDRAARGTLYHEAFHAVTQTLLSDDELNALYDAGVKHYKETDVALVEELLAEDFRRYVQMEETPVIGPIRKFFRKIMNALRNFSGYRAPIQELFYRINNGEFADMVPREMTRDNAFYRSLKDFYIKDENKMNEIRNTSKYYQLNNSDVNIAKTSWTRFINYWVGQGYRPIGYRKNGAYHIIGAVANKDYAAYEREKESRAYRGKYRASQAQEGIRKKQAWERLSREQIEAFKEAGLSRETWDTLSTKEQEQWLICRG